MQLTSIDLHKYNLCPKKYFSSPKHVIKPSVTRDVIKRVVLSKALGRENRWTVNGLASVWDNYFWGSKSISQDNIDRSVKGTMSLRKLFNRLPESYEAHSSTNLLTAVETDLYLKSSSDFFLVSERGVEIWIYYNTTPKQVRRSIIGATELFILKRATRKNIFEEFTKPLDPTRNKDVFIVFYNAGNNSLEPTWFRLKCTANEKAVISLSKQIYNKVEYSNQGEQCQNCKVDC